MPFDDDFTWIKLYRRSIRSRVFQNDGLWKIWCWCLMKANHEKKWVPFKTGTGNIEIEVDRGQFIFGRKSAANELKMKQSSVWKRMQKLKDMQNLNIESNRQYSLITIINWDSYQIQKIEKEQQKEQPGNNQGTTREQPGNTNKNVKNVKNVKNIKDTPHTPHKKIVELYRNILSGLPQPTEITDTLKKSIKARWREHPDLEWWKWYFNGIRDCPFLMGKKTDWCANLNWILGPKNMTKVLSGQYLEKNKESRLKSVGEKWLERQRKKSDS